MSHVRHACNRDRKKKGGKEDVTVRTFADIDDERIWAWGHVDPFSRHILYLQARVIRRLQ
jgi:hypothetical protein